MIQTAWNCAAGEGLAVSKSFKVNRASEVQTGVRTASLKAELHPNLWTPAHSTTVTSARIVSLSCPSSATLTLPWVRTGAATDSLPLPVESSYLLSGCCGHIWLWGVWWEADSRFLKRQATEIKQDKCGGFCVTQAKIVEIALLCREKVRQQVGSSKAFRLTTVALQRGWLWAPCCTNAPF